MLGNSDSSESIFKHSLRPCRLLMCLMGIVPFDAYQVARQRKHFDATWRSIILRLLQNVVALASIGIVSWRRQHYSNELAYNKTDDLSGDINVIGYIALVLVHFIVQLESTWKTAHFYLIFEHFERMRTLFVTQLGVTLDLKVIRCYSDWLNVLFMFYAPLTIILTFTQGITSTTITLYSELVTKMKMIEFCLISAVVLALQQQLYSAGVTFVRELHATRFDAWPRRRLSLARIYVLQDLHAELWACMRVIEKYFEWSLAGLFLKIFLDLTLLSYWLYQSFDCNTGDMLKAYCIGFMSLQLIMMSVLCTICSFCEVMDKRFRLLFYSVSTDRRNIYLSSCLREMNLQLMHEAIQFSAGGFVDINVKTLGSFVFSVITFIVILIQFRMADKISPC